LGSRNASTEKKKNLYRGAFALVMNIPTQNGVAPPCVDVCGRDVRFLLFELDRIFTFLMRRGENLNLSDGTGYEIASILSVPKRVSLIFLETKKKKKTHI
jgi:hypothetical protein